MPINSPAESLTCEYQRDPLGIDVARPRLGWRLEAQERDVVHQTRTRADGATKSGSVGDTSNAAYQASRFRTVKAR